MYTYISKSGIENTLSINFFSISLKYCILIVNRCLQNFNKIDSVELSQNSIKIFYQGKQC